MKDTPNIDPNKSSSIGHKVEFWAGVVVGYEHQEEQLASGNGWRYKVRLFAITKIVARWVMRLYTFAQTNIGSVDCAVE